MSDGHIKRIVTARASANCYGIISIAQASVEEGGLPSMPRSAMSAKILFRPTLEEGRLMRPDLGLENLGHATAAFTLDVYGHVTAQMKKASADRMEQKIRAVSGL